MIGAEARRPKVLAVFGTRPDTIKMAPVVRALAAERRWCDLVVVLTAQHRDLVSPLLSHFEITPNYDLDVMRANQSLSDLTARLFTALAPVFEAERPQWLLVQGDTTTSLVAAMAAFYHRVAIGHIEAGLRTGDRGSPFPEEGNRRVIAQLADLHFAPTARAASALRAEGVAADRIVVAGNTAIDALKWTVAQGKVTEAGTFPGGLNGARRVILVTTHRRESFGPRLEATCRAVDRIAQHYGRDVEIVFPVHPHPTVQASVHRLLEGRSNVHLLPPLSYPDLIGVLARAALVLTDSGGLQEEAPSLGKPLLVLRDNTERPEGIEAGVARLVGTGEEAIVAATRELLDDDEAYERMARPSDLYGDGHAAERVVEALRERAFRPV